jgi:hypothetical protein
MEPQAVVMPTRKHNGSETGLRGFALLGPLERANLNHWGLRTKTALTPEAWFSSFWNTGRWTKSRDAVVLEDQSDEGLKASDDGA